MINTYKYVNKINTEMALSKKNNLKETDNPNVRCTEFPEFWRANKKFPYDVCVHFLNNEVPDGTSVRITACNHKNSNPELKNNSARIVNGVARFNDFRFIGKSGRGKFS